MYLRYTDDLILAGPDPNKLDAIIQKMKSRRLKITSEGGIEDFLGFTIERKNNGTVIDKIHTNSMSSLAS
jgi:hypothetical protein